MHDDHEAKALVPLLVNVAEATAMLSISRSTLYQMIWLGQLRPVHIGRCVRFDPNELSRFVREAAGHVPESQ